jgi:Mg2+-importing ATPase
VVEGRRSFGNIMKYVLMATGSNFGNMLSMALASLVLPFLPMLPLQILLNNFLYDLAQVAIPSDRVDRTWQRKPRRWDVAFIRRYMLTIGPISSVFDLITFAVMLAVFHTNEPLFRTGWFVESLATQTLVIFVIRTAAPPWTVPPGRGLTLGVAASLGVGVLSIVHAAGDLARLRPPAAAVLRLPGRHDGGVPRRRRDRQEAVLPDRSGWEVDRCASDLSVSIIFRSMTKCAGSQKIRSAGRGLAARLSITSRVA